MQGILPADEVYSELLKMLESASSSVTLVSPFLSIDLFKKILKKIDSKVHVTVITKWHLGDLLSGFNDLRVMNHLEERGNSELRLLYNLHAKYYRADSEVVFGSGNLTFSGVNAKKPGNTEIMVRVDCNFSGILDFENRLIRKSVLPREGLFEEISEELELLRLTKQRVERIRDFKQDQIFISNHDWLPECETPDALFEIYQQKINEIAVEVANSGGNDLMFFEPPEQMDKRQFEAFLRIGVSQSSLFSQILEIVKDGTFVDDQHGIEIIKSLHPLMSNEGAAQSWASCKRWLAYFFPSDFKITVR